MSDGSGRTSVGVWTVRLLLVAAALAVTAALAWWAGWLVSLLPAVVIAYAAVAVGTATWRGAAAARAFRDAHPDKDLLLVYSNRPQWKAYIEREWLPRWGARAVVLNWSERSHWATEPTAAATLFRSVSGKRENNPIAIVVPSVGAITVIRFWRAFRDQQHGREHALRTAEVQLARALGEQISG